MAGKNTKKNIPLRLSSSLYAEILKWAEDDFRSLNGQIEYLLTECVNRRKKNTAKADDSNAEIEELKKQLAITQNALMSETSPDRFVIAMNRAGEAYEKGESLGFDPDKCVIDEDMEEEDE